jgi:hypothetical protein
MSTMDLQEDDPLLETADDYDAVPPTVVLPPDAAPVADPSAVAAPPPQTAPADHGDVLRNYFMSQKQNRDRLASAESSATNNRFMARLGGAFNTLANAAAPRAADNSAFESMAKSANNPVDRIERRQKLEQGGDKMLLNYFMRRDNADSLNAWRDRKAGQGDRRLDISESLGNERNRIMGDRAKTAERSLGLRGRALELRETALAAGAVKTINNDKVVSTTEQQLNSANKGIGRLDAIDRGEAKFSTTTKADLEADLASLISGSNNTALGKLERVEFHPYIAKWQSQLDAIKGYQGDINAPGYKQQLRDQFEGLRNDILEIQNKRKEHLLKTNKTAFSRSDLATRAMEEAAAPGTAPARKPVPAGTPGAAAAPKRSVSAKELSDYATAHYGGASPAQLEKARAFLKGQGYGTP